MSHRFIAQTLVVFVATTLLSYSAVADDKKPAPPTGDQKPAAPSAERMKDDAKKAAEGAMPPGMDPEMMKKCMEAGAPGPHHKHLAPLVGKWTCKTEWSMTPDMPPTAGEGKTEYKFIFDGRYLQQEFSAPGMDPNGPPMAGMCLMGYSNAAQRYEAIWVDNGSTSMAMMTGACSDDGKTFTFNGEYGDPMSGGKMKKFRTVTKIIDPDKHTFEYFEAGPDGKDFRSMMMTYTRAK